VYGSPEVDFVVIQQRSPALKVSKASFVHDSLILTLGFDTQSGKDEYIKALLEFIKTSKFSAVLFLSGVDLSNRMDSQMMCVKYHISLRYH